MNKMYLHKWQLIKMDLHKWLDKLLYFFILECMRKPMIKKSKQRVKITESCIW